MRSEELTGMATTPSPSHTAAGDTAIYYPTRDGRPMGETPIHRDNLITLIDVLGRWYADDPNVYVSGNMMMYYVEGDPRKHLSPDVFVTLGIPKDTPRDAYYTWLEGGRSPDLVIELTSKTTLKEDQGKKYLLYQDVLRVREYFLFDPRGEYLKPRLQGYRLHEGGYVSIAESAGRLPSEVLGLQFEPDGHDLRAYNPATGQWLQTTAEREAAERAGRLRERKGRLKERSARLRAERESESLRREIEELRRRLGTGDVPATDDLA
jgi:Uma2 family endonuclease